MEKCCQESFKLALEQVLSVIAQNKITEISALINTLSWAVETLEKDKK